MNTIYDERVKQGMAWLDEEVPGWLEEIDLDSLDLYCTCDCVLGQAFGDGAFSRMRERMGPEWVWEHGFDISDKGNDEGTERYENLTHAWINAIEAARHG